MMKYVRMSAKPSTQIQSVARACRLLLYVSEQADGCTATEVATAHEMALPTTYHLLNTLTTEGMLAKDSRRRYTIGPKVGALSDAFLRQMSAPEYLMLPLQQLAETTGETAYLTAWRGEEIRVLASVEGAQVVRVSGLHSGYYDHGHARATGKLLLAYARPELREAYLRRNPLKALTPRTIVDPKAFERELKATRERGYALELEEFAEGVGCASAPVVENGVAIAAYTVSAPIHRFGERREALIDAVVHTARAVASGGEVVSLPVAS
jgi:IclR family acetate operon transcriptional repressor